MQTDIRDPAIRRSKAAAGRFKSFAKRLGCDADKERLEAKLGKIAKAKPAPSRTTK